MELALPDNVHFMGQDLTPHEFDRQLMSMAPSIRPSRINLIANPTFIDCASYLGAHFQILPQIKKPPWVFDNSHVARQFNLIVREMREDEPEFNIDVWYKILVGYDPIKAKNPWDVQSWDYKRYEEMHLTKDQKTDWVGVLIDEECKHPGFVKSLHNCLKLDEKTSECLKRKKKTIMGKFQAATGFHS